MRLIKHFRFINSSYDKVTKYFKNYDLITYMGLIFSIPTMTGPLPLVATVNLGNDVRVD